LGLLGSIKGRGTLMVGRGGGREVRDLIRLFLLGWEV